MQHALTALHVLNPRQGEFYAFGPAFGQPGVVRFRSDQVRTTHPRPGQRHLLTAPAPSRAIRGVLGKFADLPQEAEDEIRGLNEARWRIAELDRQIKQLKAAPAAQQIDQVAVERAVTAAVERERTAWRRKLEHGRTRFRQMTVTLVATGQSLDKVKELLEETEREWRNSSTVVAAAPSSRNHQLEGTGNPANDRVASGENLDEPLKLAAGERRILTALAQYSQGRSKVQVAVLTGYTATGGGFNNYLGALRSRGLIEGDGDRLTITEAGIQMLGSWEALPTGSSLIDYWRGRLGKAERLILETLAQVYPAGLNKEEVAAQAGYEAKGGGFNNALGRLRTLELVQGRGELKASENLFDFAAN
jgi:hypothetical protein